MKLGFCLYHYFPFGGLQRDCIQIAQKCRERGHDVSFITTSWRGEAFNDLPIHLLPAKGWSNHKRMQRFAQSCQQAKQQLALDALISFNKLPGADIYYAAEGCLQTRCQNKPHWQRQLPRYRCYLRMEQQLFSSAHTDIVCISPKETQHYQQAYGTSDKRCHSLSPGLHADRQLEDDEEQLAARRQQRRQQWNVAENDTVLLMIGCSFKTKGVDRALHALAALPDVLRQRCRLLIAGKGEGAAMQSLAAQLQLSSQVKFLGARDDINDCLLAADLLLQPSRVDNTGTAIIEAMNAGLPVLATAACGFATIVKNNGAGCVVEEPFTQYQLNQQLYAMLTATPAIQSHWRKQGKAYAKQAALFNYPERAARLIETILTNKDE